MLDWIREQWNRSVSRATENALRETLNAQLSEQDWGQATRTLEHLQRLCPEDRELQLVGVKLDRRLGRLERGVPQLLRLLGEHPELASEVLRFVEAFREQQASEVARELLEQSVRRLPGNLDLRFRWAWWLYEEGEVQEAAGELQWVLSRQPDHLEAHLGLGFCQVLLGDKQEAMLQVEQVQRLDSTRAGELLSAIYENPEHFHA